MGVMKATWAFGAVIAGVTTLHALKIQESGTVSGKVSPPDGAKFAWAINGTDSSKTSLADGKFLFKLKPGSYKIIVDATEPLKDAVIDAVQINDGKTVDLGEIPLKP